jgi:hypothetical protein
MQLFNRWRKYLRCQRDGLSLQIQAAADRRRSQQKWKLPLLSNLRSHGLPSGPREYIPIVRRLYLNVHEKKFHKLELRFVQTSNSCSLSHNIPAVQLNFHITYIHVQHLCLSCSSISYFGFIFFALFVAQSLFLYTFSPLCILSSYHSFFLLSFISFFSFSFI